MAHHRKRKLTDEVCADIRTGAELKIRRLRAGLTREQAAEAEGVTPRAWSYWEAGRKLPPAEKDAPSIEKLFKRLEQHETRARRVSA